MLDNDASTAKTLTLVAIILQMIFFAAGLIMVVGLSAFLSFSSVASTGTVTTTAVPNIFAIVLAVFSIFFIVGAVWILLDYFLVYKKLANEKVKEAETPSLVLGIVQLIFAGVIAGILLIVAYVKIRDSIDRGLGQKAQNPPI